MAQTEGVREPDSWVPRSDVEFEHLATTLRSLASPTRLRLLHLLTKPHYIEEVASLLRMSLQGARKHLAALLEAGLVRKQAGRREGRPVVEYVLARPELFRLYLELEKLSVLRPASESTAGLATHAETRIRPSRVGAVPQPGLRLVRGWDVGRVFALADQEGRQWTIGRGREAAIRLDYDPYLSTNHAEVRRTPTGFVLVDAGSRNGTSLNGEALEPQRPTPLSHGDVVGVGRSLLVFQAPSA